MKDGMKEERKEERNTVNETVARLIHPECPSVSVHPPLSGIPSSLSPSLRVQFIIMIIIAPLIFYHSVQLSLSQGALEKYSNRRELLILFFSFVHSSSFTLSYLMWQSIVILSLTAPCTAQPTDSLALHQNFQIYCSFSKNPLAQPSLSLSLSLSSKIFSSVVELAQDLRTLITNFPSSFWFLSLHFFFNALLARVYNRTRS